MNYNFLLLAKQDEYLKLVQVNETQRYSWLRYKRKKKCSDMFGYMSLTFYRVKGRYDIVVWTCPSWILVVEGGEWVMRPVRLKVMT